MVFAIIWAVFIGAAFSIAIIAEQKKDKKHREEVRLFLQSAIKQPPFSVPEYYDRAQQQQETLQAEKENQKPYAIILWWGLDGLRLNDDGSFEWIRKNQKTVGVSYRSQQTINKEIYELEEKIRNYPKNTPSLPDEYWIMIHTLNELYRCQQIQDSLTKCCCEEYGLPKV